LSENEEVISVKVLEKRNTQGFFDSIQGIAYKSVDIPAQILIHNLQQTIETLAKALDSATINETKFLVDKITFNLGIEATGKISLIGEIGASSNSSISITLKKRRDKKNV
jgi:hypothetical protein